MSSQQSTIEATKEIQSKLNKVSELIAADADTISKQDKIIQQQRQVIEKQQTVLTNVRNELIEMKKQILINEAKSTPKDFRDNITKYLLNLRQELVKLDAQNKKDPDTQSDEKLEAKSNAIDTNDTYSMTPSGQSALYIAAGRAIESKRGGKDRLFLDEYADIFASANNNSGYNFISLFSDAVTQMNAANNITGGVTVDYLAMFVAFRTKWIDDSIYYALNSDKRRMRDGLTKGTIKQIVVVGVGCDTRSFRLSKLPKDLQMYHIDKMDVIAFRKSVLKNDLGVCQYVDIECDLAKDGAAETWMDKLCKAGFKPNRKCIWICEGVLEYIEHEKLESMLKVMSKNSFEGSWLIGEIPNVVNVELKAMHDVWVNLGGQRIVSGVDLPQFEILDRFGFTELQHVNTLGTFDSNYRNRAPPAYVQYETASKPMKGDKVTRIQLFRGMKCESDEDFKAPL